MSIVKEPYDYVKSYGNGVDRKVKTGVNSPWKKKSVMLL